MALTVNTSALTAIANDYGFEMAFTRQLEGLAQTGDALIAISTSGNSPNIVHALRYASALRVKTIAFTGESGGKLHGACDLCLGDAHEVGHVLGISVLKVPTAQFRAGSRL